MFNNNIYEYPSSDNILIIGDIHGDIDRLYDILLRENIINNNFDWIAKPLNTIVIQLGDQIDSKNRGEYNNWEKTNDTDIIFITNILDNIAKVKGGRFISLIGNHELMNVLGMYSYVSNSNMINRNYYFNKKNGCLINILAKRPIIVKIGKYLFCHAGLRIEHYKLLNKYNKSISYINELWRKFILNLYMSEEDKLLFDALISNTYSILWTRVLDNYNNMKYLMNELKTKYMIIGHTTVDEISLINEYIWYIDTGISRAFGRKKYQYMRIVNDKIYIKNIQSSK